jgi:uncharacterized nucleotidyltransferase DUF6036
MRKELTRARLLSIMKELAKTAPRRGPHRVYLVGGGTAVYLGWRTSSLDADLCADREDVFRDIQGIKERLNVNVDFARPEDFVPPLQNTAERHIFIEKIGTVTFYHYDPYAQILAKVVRGFQRDLEDARKFVSTGMVDPARLRTLVEAIPDAMYARYPSLSQAAVGKALSDFLAM